MRFDVMWKNHAKTWHDIEIALVELLLNSTVFIISTLLIHSHAVFSLLLLVNGLYFK